MTGEKDVGVTPAPGGSRFDTCHEPLADHHPSLVGSGRA